MGLLRFLGRTSILPALELGRFGSLFNSKATRFRIHGLGPSEFLRLTHNSAVDDGVSGDAETICRILSKHPSDSNIEACLAKHAREVSPELVNEVLRRLTNAGTLALSFFNWAESQNGFRYSTESFHSLIEALGKIKQFKLIWELVEKMKSHHLLTRETFGLIMRRYARARKIKEAVLTLDKMEYFGLKPELSDFNRLLDTLGKAKNIMQAQEVFNENNKKRRFSPDLKSYSILIEGWGNEGNFGGMKKVFKEMTDEGFRPDVVTYGIFITAYCKVRMFGEAIKVLNEMKSSDCKPSPHMYCALINGLGSEKRLDEALEYFEQSKAQGFMPDIPTLNAIVGSYCWSSRFVDAYKMVEEMKRLKVGPNARTYEIILHHLIRENQTEEAYRLFQGMSGGDVEPEINVYAKMVKMFCDEGRVDMAMEVWEQMKAKGVIPCLNMFSSLIDGLCAECRIDEACTYFQEMLNKGIRPPGKLYGNLKQALLDQGRNDLVLELGLKLDRLRKTQLVLSGSC
ncbi:Pentatricopeptide repeat-containing protein [Acorus gramineus]|uniref:Pentatricopeptide repeat-containing protein n=1 Tax=Acorus gramineus TaxID=55184 RepID=A0AAV9BYQ7_ACOGR|nr:Pentatricopeptide repeat-containing protein [Acorus gramineus]